MTSHSRRHARIGLLGPLLFLLTLAALMLGSALDSVAQQGPQLQANPTQEPTTAPIDDIVANPTDPPTEDVDDIVANSTARPSEEPIDDIVADPTEEPGLDEAVPTTGTVRVIKRDCPLGIVETATVSEYLYLCPQEHNGVEFVLNDVNGAQLGTTAGGQVEWTGVDPGVFNITETLPAGYTDPLVFCGYTESPGGGVQHPALMDAVGGIVAGTFPDAMFEYVCYWMNIKDTSQGVSGADDVAIAERDAAADLLITKRVCPNDIPPGQSPAYYIEHCTEIVDGIEFTVTDANGSSTKPIADGEAEWSGIPLGPFTVDEDIPVQYGEPIVFCGWTAIYDGVAYDAFAQLVPSPGGTVDLDVLIPGAFHYCYYFNIKGVDDLAAPGALDNTLVTRKWSCPDGTLSGQADRDYYVERCELLLEPIEFTLTTTNGDETKATSGGFAEWTGLPLGELTLTEAIPSGYGAPVFFCGWYAYYDGYHYDAFPSLFPSSGGVVEGAITIPNTDYFCDVFNIAGDIDDVVANPTVPPTIDDFQGNATAGAVRLVKRDCPPGVPTDATLADYLDLCHKPHNHVDFTLETADGIAPDTTHGGKAEWTGVPSGAFAIQEAIPAGYGDPIVFCGFTESQGGGVQHPAQQSAPGGLVEGAFPENTIFEYVCYWMNIPAAPGLDGPDAFTTGVGGGLSTLTIRNVGCSGGWSEGMTLDVLDGSCFEDVSGATFAVTHANGSSSKPIVNGEATWLGLPLAPYTIDEAVPGGYADPLVSCALTAFGQDDAWLLSAHALFETAVDGVIDLALDPPGDLDIAGIARMQTTCTYYNFPLEPGSFTQAEDLTNSLTVRKWICEDDAQAIADQDYLEARCQLSTTPVEFKLTNADGESTQATSPHIAFWGDLSYGTFSLQETIPDGFGEPITFCEWTAFYEGNIYDSFPHLVPSPDGLIEGEITIPNTSYACDVYNIATGAGVGGPDSVTANPQDESNTLVAHTWLCPEGAAADAHLLDYVDLCQLADEPVEFTLNNDDGESAQATAGGTAQWDDVPLGQFTLRETIPAGYEVLVVWCGWTAFHDGAVYDAFSQPKESQDGLVIGEISVPNTHYRCDFINAPVVIDDIVANPTEVDEIDDLQANPTEEPTEEPIDDVQANPLEPGTLIVHTWICPAAYDPVAGDALADCTEPHDGVTFDLVNHAAGEPDFQATTGDEVAGTAVFAPQPGTYSLKEQIPDGYGEPFLWNCTGLSNVPDALEPPISTINFFRIVIASGQVIECDWMNVPAAIDDLTANPTGTSTGGIDDVTANPVPGALTISLAECDADRTPGIDIYRQDVEYLSVWCSEPTTEFEFMVSSEGGFSDTKTTAGYVVSFAEIPLANISISATIPEGWIDPMSLCWSDQAGSTGWRVGNDATWSVGSGENIECTWVNVMDNDNHVVTIGNLACPAGVDPTDDYWVAIGECDEPLGGVEFTLTTDAGAFESVSGGVTDAIGGAVWVNVDLGDSGELEIEEDVPDGYGEPEVWCASYPEVERADPFDNEFIQYQVQNGAITATPEQHEPFRFACVFFNIPDDGPGQGNGNGQGKGNEQGSGSGQGRGIRLRPW